MAHLGEVSRIPARSRRGVCQRAIYTVRFESAVYVLHVFQKKSKSGIATPKQDIELIENRLKVAQEHHQTNYEN
ncbi:MAG: type II toxin-antitoxin system RelE/ParE family toxin [Microcoleus sp.]